MARALLHAQLGAGSAARCEDPVHTRGKVTATTAHVLGPAPKGQEFREGEAATETRRLGKVSWKRWNLS